MSDNRAVHSARLERWLGSERVEQLSKNMQGWYGPPIPVLDLPGGVKIHGDGDFSGPFERGYFCSAFDALESRIRILKRRFNKMRFNPAELHAGGFTSISSALLAMSQAPNAIYGGININKVGTASGAVGGAVDLWYVGTQPAAGAAGAVAPTGTTPTNTSTGAIPFYSGVSPLFTMLTGADLQSSVATTSLMLYDRLFSVAATMNSTAAITVSGTPTRYTGTTAGVMGYCGGNFVFPVCSGTVLPATAHNWTVCKYTNQAGSSATFPSATGISACAVNRIDLATGWFMPLASGDVGMTALTQEQSSAAVASGTVDFVMGHSIGIMSFPIANFLYPFDFLTNRNLAPRIFDGACLALMQLPQAASSASTFTGCLYAAQQ